VGAPGLYHTLRALWGLGEAGELEGKIPLEVNLDLTNCVSFSKGCYLGQELTARTKYKVGGAGGGLS
jgi:folate-binding protein YgfZ